MGPLATVRVNNNFTARKSGVAMRTSDDKLTGWVYMVLDIGAKKILNALG